jgi:hypothetical protein
LHVAVAARLLSIWLRGDAAEFEIGECEVLEQAQAR